MTKRDWKGYLWLGFIIGIILGGSFGLGTVLLAAPTNSNRAGDGFLYLEAGGDGLAIGGDTQIFRSGANTWSLGSGDSLTGATWVNSTSSSTTNAYFNGEYFNETEVITYPEQTPSYIIWNDTLIYAKNGVTGEITSNAVFADLWQECHDTLTAGGSIFLKQGLYILTKTLNMTNHGIYFTGESMWRGTEFSSDPQLAGIRLAANINKNMIYVTGQKCRISNIYLDGNKAQNTAGDGIETGNSASLDLHMDNVYIFSCALYGLHFPGGASNLNAVYIEYCGEDGVYNSGRRNTFNGCSSWGNTKYGFTDYNVEPDAPTVYSGCISAQNGYSGVRFLRNKGATWIGGFIQQNNRYGVFFSGGQNNIVSGAMIVGNGIGADNTYSQVYFGSTTDHSLYNILTGNQIFSSQVNQPKYCVEEADANQDYNQIYGNIFKNADTGIARIQGVNTEIFRNQGYVTENSGTAQIDAGQTTVSVTHGLSYTPTAQHITITPTNSTSAALDWYPAGIGATTFNITVTGAPAAGAPFSWHITKTP